MIKIALDAMGGDDAPASIVAGAVQAVRSSDIEVILVGDEGAIRQEVVRHGGKGLPLKIVHAPQTVAMHESPSSVVRRKRDSSIWIATDLVRQGEASAVISAGNTGAAMATALFLLGPLRGVERPAIGTVLPTLTGVSLLLDVGANVDCKPQHLLQFAVMGHAYAERIMGRPRPRIGLLSIGEEDTKGNELTKEVFKMLKDSPFNFIGNVEGRDVYLGSADVIVCDGFIGNIALKISEGLADTLLNLLKREISKSFMARMGYLLLRSSLANFQRKMDYAEYGGAPLLGVNGVCIICHGRSSARAIKNAIKLSKEFVDRDLNGYLQGDIERYALVLKYGESSG
ncbi:MAG TPA: phosphate acyltransferase PlsX [Nitrospiria bacterium]|nr:phosphate acyltransferase PlsX [Nitrospiria bacterium]